MILDNLLTFTGTSNGATGGITVGTSDTFLDAWMPMMPYGADANFYVRQPGVKSALVQFDLAGISSVAYVSQAQIGVWVTYSSGNPVDMSAYGVLKPWSEAGATWMEADAGMAWETPGAMGPSDRSSTMAMMTGDTTAALFGARVCFGRVMATMSMPGLRSTLVRRVPGSRRLCRKRDTMAW